MLEEQIRECYPHLSDEDVLSKKDEDFPLWVKAYVHANKLTNSEDLPIWVQELVEGPMTNAQSWPIYYTRGYLFHTRKHGHRRKTCNYGICVRGANYSDASDEDDFNGNLEDIIQLEYPGFVNLKITIFKCDWYDPTIGKGTRKNRGGTVDVLSTGRYPHYEPFVLASQADQVCYIPYPYTKQPRLVWLNVCKVNPRGNITGKLQHKEPILLQQDTDDDALLVPIEDIAVDNLAFGTQEVEEIDYEVGDAEAEDEFQCNISTSDEDENEEGGEQ